MIPTNNLNTEANQEQITNVTINFEASITLEGKNLEDIQSKWEKLNLFSEDADQEGCEYMGLLSVIDNIHDFKDITFLF